MTGLLKDKSLTPARALLHPAFVGSLALLLVNDHVLKQSGALPGVLTGKLSDFAGLMVAPTVLMVMLSLAGLRDRRNWLGCHLAVGAVFAGIQIVPAVAAGWSNLIGALGVSWVTTMDPTDLIALPMLAVSYLVLGRHMQTELEAAGRRLAEIGTGALGLFATVATSPGGGGWEEGGWEEGGWFPDIDAEVYLHNATNDAKTVYVRPVNPALEMDCDAIAEDPGRLLTADAFGEALEWSIPSGANVPIDLDESTGFGCGAYEISGPLLPTRVVFYDRADYPWSWIPGQSALGEVDFNGVSVTENDFVPGSDFVFARSFEEPELPGSCVEQYDGDRVDWSDPVATGVRRIESMEEGIDGCLILELAQDFQVENGIEGDDFYLCLPPQTWPFEAGEWVDVSALAGAVETLNIQSLDFGRSLMVARGNTTAFHDSVNLALRESPNCPAVVDESCGTVAESATVRVEPDLGDAVDLRAGEEVTYEGPNGHTTRVLAVHAEFRHLVDLECAEGPDGVGGDVEVVIVETTEG